MEEKEYALEYCPAFQKSCALCARKVECFDMDVLLRRRTASLAALDRRPVSPRVSHQYADRRETCCRTCCEEAVRLLAQLPGGVHMIRWNSGAAAQPVENHTVVRYHRAVHKACARILQNRVYPLAFRLQLLGIAVRDLDQVRTEDDALAWVMRYRYFYGFDERLSDRARRLEESRSSVLRGILFLLSQEKNNASVYWNGFIAEILQSLQVRLPGDGRLQFSYNRYRELARNFSARPEGETLLENLLVNALVEESFPLGEGEDAAWVRYLTLCLMYDLMKLTAVVHAEKHPSLDERIRNLSAALRYFYYRKPLWTRLARELAQEKIRSGQNAAGLLRV